MKSEKYSFQVYFVGCIGDDKFGKRLSDEVRKSGVITLYHTDTTTPTGVSACMVTSDAERTLVANIGASAKLPLTYFDQEKVKTVLTRCEAAHIEGSFFD